MTREPNPYAKEPALTVNKAVLMAVPSVVAEDVLDGPDVVDAQHQKNADIHVSSADREKWDEMAETHVRNSIYSSEEFEGEVIDAVCYMFMLAPMLMNWANHLTEISLHFCKEEKDYWGESFDTVTPYYLDVVDMNTGDFLATSINAVVQKPGTIGTFFFEQPLHVDPESAFVCYLTTDPNSGNAYSGEQPIGLRVIPDVEQYNAMVRTTAYDEESGDCFEFLGAIILTAKSTYVHATDTDKHITVEEREKWNNGILSETNKDKLRLISTGTRTYTGSASQFESLAIGGTVTQQESTAVGIYSAVRAAASVALGNNVTVTGRQSTGIGYTSELTGDFSFLIGAQATLKDAGTGALKVSNYPYSTYFYIIGAGTPLATTYEDGEACLGYVVKDKEGNISACGTRKLSELLTNNTTFAPTSLDPDAEPPKVFMPTGILDPEPEPKLPEEETPEETQEKTETLFEKLKAKFAEFLKNNKE